MKEIEKIIKYTEPCIQFSRAPFFHLRKVYAILARLTYGHPAG